MLSVNVNIFLLLALTSSTIGVAADHVSATEVRNFGQRGDQVREELELAQTHAETDPSVERVSITGVRVTQGDAVNCPQIRDDSGGLHSVSYLTPATAIGARVTVRGFYAVTTACNGIVLAVEDQSVPNE